MEHRTLKWTAIPGDYISRKRYEVYHCQKLAEGTAVTFPIIIVDMGQHYLSHCTRTGLPSPPELLAANKPDIVVIRIIILLWLTYLMAYAPIVYKLSTSLRPIHLLRIYYIHS